MTLAAATEQMTEADTEISSRVTRSVFDNFMRRPSIEDQAIQTIAAMANNDLAMMRNADEDPVLCDAAFVFIDRKQARFLISGRSSAWHFGDGKLLHRSLTGSAMTIGTGPRYTARLEPVFELCPEKNAFLAGSPTLAASVNDSELEELLKVSASPKEWMDRLVEKVGPDKEFCAIAAFLPDEKPSLLKKIINHV